MQDDTQAPQPTPHHQPPRHHPGNGQRPARPMSMEFTNVHHRRPIHAPVTRPNAPLPPQPAPPVATHQTQVHPQHHQPHPPVQPPQSVQPQQPHPHQTPVPPPELVATHATAPPPPKKQPRNKLVRLGIVAFGALIIIIAGLFLTNNIALSKFKTVTYNNGDGTTFTMKFYSRSSVEKAPKDSPATNQLVSKVSANGKSPIVLQAETSNFDSPAFSNNDCTQTKLPKAFDVKIDYINATVPVCAVTAQNTDLIYRMTFHDSKHDYIVNISQVADYRSALVGTPAAKALFKKIGLTDYQPDLQTILASLKPDN